MVRNRLFEIASSRSTKKSRGETSKKRHLPHEYNTSFVSVLLRHVSDPIFVSSDSYLVLSCGRIRVVAVEAFRCVAVCFAEETIHLRLNEPPGNHSASSDVSGSSPSVPVSDRCRHRSKTSQMKVRLLQKSNNQHLSRVGLTSKAPIELNFFRFHWLTKVDGISLDAGAALQQAR